MSTKSAPFYWIECDEPGCKERCPGGDSDDCIAYVTAEQAMDVADVSEWSLDHNKAGKDYCPDHVPIVIGCDCDLLEKPDSPKPCETFRPAPTHRPEKNSAFCAVCTHLEECHS